MAKEAFCLVFAAILRFSSILCLTQFAVGQESNSTARFPVGDVRNCFSLAQGINRLEVLPGGGWDNLRNVHMGMVTYRNYSQCKTTEDGKYLIPDDTFVYPLKKSNAEVFAEVFDHWTNYSSTTSTSINVEASGSFGFGSISASFSEEHESIKKHQVEDKAVTTRVQLRYVMYKVRSQPDGPLQPVFKTRLLDIAAQLQLNNTAFANFLAQLLVRDFGTHYVTSVDAGAVLAKIDHLKYDFVSKYAEQKNKVTASAGASFFGAFSVKGSISHSSDSSLLDEYTKSTTFSRVLTYGGPPFRANFTLDQWEDDLPNNLVTIDRAGDPLHFAVTPGSLPEISQNLAFQLATVVERAVLQYYKHNTYKGCTDSDAPNFSFQANLDDGSCRSPYNNFTFGGVYQTCQIQDSPSSNPCGALLQKNPLTAGYSCPVNYDPVLLHQTGTPTTCHRDCHSCWLFFKCCHTDCGRALVSTYWCVAKGKVSVNTGYLFGGLYSDKVINPVSQDHRCPLKFKPLRFGATMRVCVSDDYELGFKFSVPFAGFFSCAVGNPLATSPAKRGNTPSSWSKDCPTGYAQHLAAIEDDCEINYCVKANAFSDQGLAAIKRPPFSHAPKIYNYSVPALLVNEDTGQIFFKSKAQNEKEWILATKA